ncbi:MAG: ORF6N domain-containing protein [Saprospiraceae bacterium]|nr:ORF6N domain-containing protein [Saprospiraceae bacterium]
MKSNLQPIHQKIYTIRGQRVLLDFDLADLYEVPTKVLNQAVKRNLLRFPEDFMFQLSSAEWQELKSEATNWSQIVTSSNRKFRGNRYRPFAFTEQGVAMLSSVLHSEKAIQVNIAIMRAFVALRNYMLGQSELERQIAELETRFQREFADVHEALKWLAEENQARAAEMAALEAGNRPDPDWENRERIGFRKR